MSRPYTPAIPPLSTIKDPDTRRALEALVNGWRVRNGETQPDSDERFVRKGEIQGLASEAAVKYFSSRAGALALSNALTNTPNNPLGDYIRGIISDLERDVMNTPLWRKLGEKINLIDPPQIFSRIGNVETVVRSEVNRLETANEAAVSTINAIGARVGINEAGLLTEQTARTNSDNALAQAVNTIWAAVGNSSALVQSGSNVTVNSGAAIATNWNQVQAAIKDPFTGQYVSTAAVRDEARAEADSITNRLTAERTIKVDVNGYVAGIGVIANADLTSGTTSSDIIVRADRFSVGTAQGPGITPRVPFIVTTTPTVLNGKTLDPGVYMNYAMIGTGFIGKAMIGVAQVDTLILAGNAATVPVAGDQSSVVYWYGAPTVPVSEWTSDASTLYWKTVVANITVNYGTAEQGVTNAKGILGFSYQTQNYTGGAWFSRWRVVRDDTTTIKSGDFGVANNTGGPTVAGIVFDDTAVNGTHTYKLQVAVWGSLGSVYYPGLGDLVAIATGGTLFALGAKR